MIHAILNVFAFEWRRSLTIGRLATWLILVMVPIILIGIVKYETFRMQSNGFRKQDLELQNSIATTLTYLFCYILIPQVACMLGLLLWATPSIHSELEGNTWSYLTMRPHGKQAVLFGKYLVAVFWAFSAGLVSSVAIGFIQGYPNGWNLTWVLAGLSFLASICYGALYLLIGVVVIKRAIVVALAYSLVVEYAVSYIPATINQFTISYRLRGLLFHGLPMHVDGMPGLQKLYGPESVWQQLFWLAVIATTLLCLASLVLRYREIPMETEA